MKGIRSFRLFFENQGLEFFLAPQILVTFRQKKLNLGIKIMLRFFK